MMTCHRKVAALFRTVDGVHTVLEPGQALPRFDYHAALMSLPLAFKTDLDTVPATVPYVRADENGVAAWRDRLHSDGGELKVGLVWSGNPEFPGARAKACPVERVVPLLNVAGCAFYGLQTGDTATDIGRLVLGQAAVMDLSRDLDTFADTAALVSVLDLVITVDTATAHLAGALGKPTWILLPYAADWRWLRRHEDSPWYPTARLFRQAKSGDWDGVVRRVVEELVALVEQRRARGRPS